MAFTFVTNALAQAGVPPLRVVAGIALTIVWTTCSGDARATATSPGIQADATLTCFQGQALATKIRDQVGQAKARGWTLQLHARPSIPLELTLKHWGRRIGVRPIAHLPSSCAEQLQLVTTIAVLAIEQDAQARKRKRRSKKRNKGLLAKPKFKQQKTRDTSPPPKNENQANRPLPSTPSVRLENENQANRSQRSSTNTERPSSTPSQAAASDSVSTTQATATSQTPTSPATDPARALARRLAAQRKVTQQRARAKRPPFRLERGLGFGAAWGVAAQAGPELEGWLGGQRPRWSMRAGLRLAYGLPRPLGPAKLHTAVAGLNLRVCLRPGALIPTSTLEFWTCIGGMGALIWARGLGSDSDAQGVRPLAAPTLSLEFPLAKRGTNHWALALRGGVNLLRTEFQLRSTQGKSVSLHSQTLPGFHLSLSVLWRNLRPERK